MSRGKIVGDGPGQYRIGPTLGKGAFSTVYECTRLVDGKNFAIKVVSKASLRADPELEEALCREINSMESIRHSEFITNMADKLVSPRNYYIVMDLVKGGTLMAMVLKSRTGLHPNRARLYFRQLLLGLSAVHSSNVVHRDIKPENMLLDETKTVLKLSDFGFACYSTPTRRLTRKCCTVRYSAPEMHTQDSYYGRDVDLWAAGVSLYVMLFNAYPFGARGDDTPTIIEKIVNGALEFPRRLSPSLEHLLRAMLRTDPTKRWNLDKVKSHAWVLGIDEITMTIPRTLPPTPKSGGGVSERAALSPATLSSGASTLLSQQLFATSPEIAATDKRFLLQSSLLDDEVDDVQSPCDADEAYLHGGSHRRVRSCPVLPSIFYTSIEDASDALVRLMPTSTGKESSELLDSMAGAEAGGGEDGGDGTQDIVMFQQSLRQEKHEMVKKALKLADVHGGLTSSTGVGAMQAGGGPSAACTSQGHTRTHSFGMGADSAFLSKGLSHTSELAHTAGVLTTMADDVFYCDLPIYHPHRRPLTRVTGTPQLPLAGAAASVACGTTPSLARPDIPPLQFGLRRSPQQATPDSDEWSAAPMSQRNGQNHTDEKQAARFVRNSLWRRLSFAHVRIFVNFVVFCATLLFVGALRVLFDVDARKLPLPQGVRTLLERVLAPPFEGTDSLGTADEQQAVTPPPATGRRGAAALGANGTPPIVLAQPPTLRRRKVGVAHDPLLKSTHSAPPPPLPAEGSARPSGDTPASPSTETSPSTPSPSKRRVRLPPLVEAFSPAAPLRCSSADHTEGSQAPRSPCSPTSSSPNALDPICRGAQSFEVHDDSSMPTQHSRPEPLCTSDLTTKAMDGAMRRADGQSSNSGADDCNSSNDTSPPRSLMEKAGMRCVMSRHELDDMCSHDEPLDDDDATADV